jgi:ubiquinone biosynthesis protein
LSKLVVHIRRYHITLPPPLAVLLKTIIVLEGTSRRFSPDVSLAELMQPFCRGIVMRRFGPKRLVRRARRAYRDWDRFITALPRDLTDLLARVRTLGLIAT